MFIVENGKITSGKTLDLGKRRSVDLAFAFDVSFEDTDKFELSIAETTNTLYGFTNSGKLSFAKVDLAFIGKEETEVAVSIKHNGTEILADSINVLAVIQGGGSSDIQGIIYDAFPIKNSTQVKIIPPELTEAITNFGGMFSGCSSLTSVPALDTSNGTDFNYMFNGCEALTSVPALDTSKGTNFSYMFQSCKALTSVPALDTSKGTNFGSMFNYCEALTSVPALDTSKGTSFSAMFNGCKVLTSVPALDTSNGTSFSNMFQSCSALTSVPALDTSNGTKFGAMFNYCEALTSVPALDTSNGTDFGSMFGSCKVLTSVPALDTSKGTNFSYMFGGCSALTTIQGIDFSSVTSAIPNNTFCSSLKNVTFNGTLSQSIDISNAPNLSKQSLQSLVDACIAVSYPNYITATGNALSILNSYFKTKLTNKNWGIKEG